MIIAGIISTFAFMHSRETLRHNRNLGWVVGSREAPRRVGHGHAVPTPPADYNAALRISLRYPNDTPRRAWRKRGAARFETIASRPGRSGCNTPSWLLLAGVRRRLARVIELPRPLVFGGSRISDRLAKLTAVPGKIHWYAADQLVLRDHDLDVSRRE